MSTRIKPLSKPHENSQMAAGTQTSGRADCGQHGKKRHDHGPHQGGLYSQSPECDAAIVTEVMLNSRLLLSLRILRSFSGTAYTQVAMLIVLTAPRLQSIFGGITQLTNSRLNPPAKLYIQLDRSDSVYMNYLLVV